MNLFISNLFRCGIKRLVFGVLTLALAAALSGAPDPDIFDGNLSASASASADGGSESAEEVESDSNEGNGASTGEVNQNSKITASEAANGDPASTQEGETAGGGQSGGQSGGQPAEQSGGGQSSTGTASSSTGSMRNFDEFEIGATGEVQPLSETNSSKKTLESPASSIRKVTPAANSNVQDAATAKEQSENAASQQPVNKDGSADYGTDVPSGL